MKDLQESSKIKGLIANKPYTLDDIGMSGNQVLIFEDMVYSFISVDMLSSLEYI